MLSACFDQICAMTWAHVGFFGEGERERLLGRWRAGGWRAGVVIAASGQRAVRCCRGAVPRALTFPTYI